MHVAVAQTPGVELEQWRETLALVDDLVRQAAELRAELVVLPECVWPAYCLPTSIYPLFPAYGAEASTNFLKLPIPPMVGDGCRC